MRECICVEACMHAVHSSACVRACAPVCVNTLCATPTEGLYGSFTSLSHAFSCRPVGLRICKSHNACICCTTMIVYPPPTLLLPVRQGLVTGPVLFAAQRCQGMRPLMERRFSRPGDYCHSNTALHCLLHADVCGGLVPSIRLLVSARQVARNH